MGAKWFGASVKRKEDPAFLTGRGRYIDDIRLPGMLHAVVLRSPHAHAGIGSIDKSAALALPGVVGATPVVHGEVMISSPSNLAGVFVREIEPGSITKVIDLSDDLDGIHGHLKGFKAEGGGDAPESVNQALFDSVHKIKWSTDKETLRLIFPVSDKISVIPATQILSGRLD